MKTVYTDQLYANQFLSTLHYRNSIDKHKSKCCKSLNHCKFHSVQGRTTVENRITLWTTTKTTCNFIIYTIDQSQVSWMSRNKQNKNQNLSGNKFTLKANEICYGRVLLLRTILQKKNPFNEKCNWTSAVCTAHNTFDVLLLLLFSFTKCFIDVLRSVFSIVCVWNVKATSIMYSQINRTRFYSLATGANESSLQLKKYISIISVIER